jgi:hypothetical protein
MYVPLTWIGLSPADLLAGSKLIRGTGALCPCSHCTADNCASQPVVSGNRSAWKSRYDCSNNNTTGCYTTYLSKLFIVHPCQPNQSWFNTTLIKSGLVMFRIYRKLGLQKNEMRYTKKHTLQGLKYCSM